MSCVISFQENHILLLLLILPPLRPPSRRPTCYHHMHHHHHNNNSNNNIHRHPTLLRTALPCRNGARARTAFRAYSVQMGAYVCVCIWEGALSFCRVTAGRHCREVKNKHARLTCSEVSDGGIRLTALHAFVACGRAACRSRTAAE